MSRVVVAAPPPSAGGLPPPSPPRPPRRRGGGDDPDRIARPRIDPRRTPFEQTEAFRRYGYGVERSLPGDEDRYAKALLQEQGFDAQPHVVTRAQLDAYVAAGEPELFRGIGGPSAPTYARQLRRGALYVGHGGMGGGIFAAGGPRGLEVARGYAEDLGSVLVRMSLKRGARVAGWGELIRRMAAERAGGPSRHVTVAPGVRAALTQVAGIYAAYLGYDAVVDTSSGADVWLILNRTALRIQEEDLLP